MPLSRRTFLQGSAVAVAAAGVPFGLAHVFSRRAAASQLVRDPKRVLDLPVGFSYRVLQRAGAPMSDGLRAPALPDGMACFAGSEPNTLVLMRNHEVGLADLERGPYRPGQRPSPVAYDPMAMGGVSRLVLDAESLAVRSSNMVLLGTLRNCAGGPSPWGWLSCEETVVNGHGYVFACPIDASRATRPQRIAGYGRFRHEAVAVDPATHAAYLTEDRGDGALYRFLPRDRAHPFEGRLQALRVRGEGNFRNVQSLRPGQIVPIEWVDLDEPAPRADTLRFEAQRKGAAIIRRGEGIWWSENGIYVCATTGGPRFSGQIFRLQPETTGGSLTLVTQAEGDDDLHMPDNITVGPGGHVYMAEDGTRGDNHIRVLRADGRVQDFARNARSPGELAGVCFSPDGTTMFVNLQSDGLTLAVTGPFAHPGRTAGPSR